MRINIVKTFSMIAAGLSFLVACGSGKEEPAGPNVPSGRPMTLLDQSYGEDPIQKYDIYLPKGRSSESTGVLFLIHGGGWGAGDKSEYTDMIRTLSTLMPEFAYVTIGYRLNDGNGNNVFPTQENDVVACIDFVMSKRKEYGISDKIAVMGGSAGGHLSLLYAFKHGPAHYRPRAVIDMTGPVDLISLYETTGLPEYRQWFIDAIGGDPHELTEICESSSPINFVTADSSPTLMLYGAVDDIVVKSQPALLEAKFKELGVPYEYILYPNSGHLLEEGGAGMLDKISGFLKKYLK